MRRSFMGHLVAECPVNMGIGRFEPAQLLPHCCCLLFQDAMFIGKLASLANFMLVLLVMGAGPVHILFHTIDMINGW
jgi:hypothetical protein